MNNFLAKTKEFCKKHSPIIIPTAVLTIICVVVTLALSSTNVLTEKRIGDNTKRTKKEAMQKLISADEYTEITEKLGDENVTYNKALKNGEAIGYIFTVNGKGYGGEVSVMTAVDTDGKIIAVEILDASGETPGLGQNVTKATFYKIYSGLSDEISVVKNQPNKENNEIQAVTGATISSKAVTSSVNKALKYSAQINAKEDIK